MTSRILPLAAVFLTAVTLLHAQTPPGPDTAAPPLLPEPPADLTPLPWPSETPASFSGWASVDFLHWRLKNPSMPALVTTNDLNGLPILGINGTRILYGSGVGTELEAMNGERVTLGTWLTPERRLGLEISGFWLNKATNSFSAFGSNAGLPVIGAPFYSTAFNQELAFLFSSPGSVTGGIAVNYSTQMSGIEVNSLLNVWRNETFDLKVLGGFRHLRLQEKLDIAAVRDFRPLSPPLAFQYQTLQDHFATRNELSAGQLGATLSTRYGRFTADLTGKVALGQTRGYVDVSGSFFRDQVGFSRTDRFGIYTAPSNIGARGEDSFSVVPELQIKLGFDVTSRLRATVGYNLLYWNNVVRPGNQIDRSYNTSQQLSQPLVGEARPAPLFVRENIFAEGWSAGLEFRF